MLPIFNNNWTKLLLVTILLQQLLVAGGTYFLGEVARQFPLEGLQLGTLICLFICIFLPGTIFHYGVTWCTTRAYKSVQLRYLNEYIRVNYNQPTHWRSETSKKQRHDTMCQQGQETLLSTVYFFSDVAATGLNIVLNTISVILVTDLMVGSAIFCAGFLGLGIIYASGVKISESSRNEMLANNQLNAHLYRSWDNIVLGNRFFFNRWHDHFNQLFFKSEEKALAAVKEREWVISLAGMVTNGLVLGCILSLAWIYQATTGFVLALLIMLPRSLQIVMHIQIIQSYFAQWKRLAERLAITFESVIEPQALDLSHLIRENAISIQMNHIVYPPKEIENLLSKYKTGRFTITGENGVGKSCFLLKLKNQYRCSAIYLPAQHQLMLCEAQTHLSTGEAALASLKDLRSSNDNILLLDEWDANLSSENKEIMNQIIDRLSLERIVIEIRHSIDNVALKND